MPQLNTNSRKLSLCAIALTIAVLLLSPLPAEAIQFSALSQIPGLPKALQPQGATTPDASPAQSAQVTVNGQTLFTVYADTQSKAQDRSDLVQLRLEQVLNDLEPTDPTPTVTARPVGGQVIILLNRKSLITVTSADATATGETVAALSGEWSDDISHAIDEFQRERSPGFLRTEALHAGIVLLVAALINILIWLSMRRFLDRPGWVSQTFVWLIALYIITEMFPQTRFLHTIIESGFLRPFSICIIVALGATMLTKLLKLILRHVFPPISDTLSPEERTERTWQRRSTLGAVARITGITIIWLLAVIVALSWMGVNLPALLASAGLLGVAIGLAAQDTMKDLVAGINILIDDRFGVGDYIQVGTYDGVVETLNLRITQVRDMSGRLITFPNRSIELVANNTARWAQIDFRIGVAYDTNLRETMDLMIHEAEELRKEFPHQVLAPPQMLGVEAYNSSDITLRMLVRTSPGDQWSLGRSLRLRLKEAFDANNIEIPFAQSVVHHITTEPAPGSANGAKMDAEAPATVTAPAPAPTSPAAPTSPGT